MRPTKRTSFSAFEAGLPHTGEAAPGLSGEMLRLLSDTRAAIAKGQSLDGFAFKERRRPPRSGLFGALAKNSLSKRGVR